MRLCAFVRTFSWKTKQDSRAVACSAVRSLKRPLNTISVSRSSSALEQLSDDISLLYQNERIHLKCAVGVGVSEDK